MPQEDGLGVTQPLRSFRRIQRATRRVPVARFILLTPLETSGDLTGGSYDQPHPPELARTQALCWLLDELLDAEEDLLALAARPEALRSWRRERLAAALIPGGSGGGAVGLGGAGGGVRAISWDWN
jgi:hypothetical protein